MHDRPFPFRVRRGTVIVVSAELLLRGLSARVTWPETGGNDGAPAVAVVLADDALALDLCAIAGMVVLAPARGPALPADAATAVRWAADHAAELGADPRRVLVAGAGAAGLAAAATALVARDDGWPRLVRQVLVWPVLSLPGGPSVQPREGVAPATILCSREERDDGRWYARRLRAVGVEVVELQRGSVAQLARSLRATLARRSG